MDKCKMDDIGAFAAQTAFFVVLSLVPLVMFFITLVRYTPISRAMLLEWIQKYMPGYITPILFTILDEVYSKSVEIVSVTAAVAIWSASKGVFYLSQGLNRVNEIEKNTNWLVKRIIAVFYTFLFLLAVVLMLVMLVFGKMLENLLQIYFPNIAAAVAAILGVRMLIVPPVIMFVFTVMYRYLPDERRIGTRRIRQVKIGRAHV